MDVLRQIKTLEKISTMDEISKKGMAADEFWKKYDVGEFPQYKP